PSSQHALSSLGPSASRECGVQAPPVDVNSCAMKRLTIACAEHPISRMALQHAAAIAAALLATVQVNPFASFRKLVTSNGFAPFGLDARVLVLVAELENIGRDATDVALFSIHNFHTGGGANQTAGEHITWDGSLGAYLESSAGIDAPHGVLVAKPITAAAHH